MAVIFGRGDDKKGSIKPTLPTNALLPGRTQLGDYLMMMMMTVMTGLRLFACCSFQPDNALVDNVGGEFGVNQYTAIS